VILRTESLCKSFGGLRAVNKVDLEVAEGDIHAIIGPNGAGKTTFFNLISNYLPADEGRVLFKGEEITRLPPHKICLKGVVRCFQRANIFPSLSVFESVQMAMLCHFGKSLNMYRPARGMFGTEVADILTRVGLAGQADTRGDALSHGDKKRLEFAMAVGNHPEILLLDEPTAGMSVAETKATMNLIRELRDRMGISVLFTEHDMSVVFGIAGRVTVLHQGSIIADGTPAEVRVNEEVQKVYLGVEQ
jgi:branched-chain amino acid transport system ATP-binding protein